MLTPIFIQIDNHKKIVNVEEYLRGDKEAAIRIGKLCFERWKLGKLVDEADHRISHQKQLFLEKRIVFQSTKNYTEYLSHVKDNISEFVALFEKS